MTAAVLFGLYSAAAGLLAPALLRRPWAVRSPRLAMTLWLVLPLSWVAAVVLVILAATAPFPMAWPDSPPSGGQVVPTGHAAPGGPAIGVAGLVLAAAIFMRAAVCVALELHRGRRAWREHAAMVVDTARPGHEPGVAILDHDAPAVYCLPCGLYPIVLSAGALAALTPEQLRAVLAHERAHLRCRHHVILALATALASAFPRVPLLTQAQPQLAVLAEMAADDSAARDHSRDNLAAALVVLARAGARSATLAASGHATTARLERILDPRRPGPGAAGLGAIAALIPPAAIACFPLILAACDLTSHR